MQQGERQIGSYRLHEHLEHGVIADNYLATHTPTNKQVVVKVFQTLSEEQLAQCMAAIHAYKRLEHPDILRLLDFGVEDDADTTSLFLVIDAPGETLRQRHPQGLPVPLDMIALYASQIASALQFAHDQHILHLNLSPEQLFVGPDGRIMLDYTSRLLYSVVPTFIPVDASYTPHEAPGPASDQYALAVLLYEWLSGRLPFNDIVSEDMGEQRTLSAPGEPVSAIWSGIEPILSRALALDPAQRYENVQSFADAFAHALNVGPEAARRRQEINRQLSSGSGSVTWGAASSIRMGYNRTARNWHNPFSSGFSFTIHSIQTLAFSPDSKRLAFTGYESVVYIADVVGPGTVFTYQGHTDPVSAVAWSPDGLTIASISSNETTGDIQIWEVVTGNLISTYHIASSMRELQWSPDGKYIAIGGWHNPIQILQPLTGEILLTYSGHVSSVSSIAWSPDSIHIASASQDGIHVWEAATGVLICTYRGHFGEVKAVAWSPDGTMLSSGGNDMTIQIWNAASRAPLFIHRLFSSTITVIGWSPDGKYIITGTHENSIQACGVEDGEVVFSYHAHVMHTEHMSNIAWSPDLNILAIGGDDRRVEIANRTTGRLLLCRAPADLIEEIGQGRASQDEMMTTTATNSISIGQTTTTTTTTTTTSASTPPQVRTTTRQHRTVNVWGGKDSWDTVTYFGHASAVKPLAWSPDSSRLASGGYDGSMHVWDAVTSTPIYIYRGHLDPIVAVAWSPDGTRLASGSLDHTVKIWDLLTGQEILTYREHKNFVQALAWSPDSTRVVSGSEDATVQVWDARSGRTIVTYSEHTAAIRSVDWSIDGQHIASGGEDQTVQIWEAATGNSVFVYMGHTAAVLAVAWSPDGKRIASSCAHRWRSYGERNPVSDHEARLHIWTPIADQAGIIYGQDEQPGLRHDMGSITWSPDGQMIATQDRSHAQVYDTGTGEVMARIMNHRPGQRVDELLNIAWSPDGTRIAGSLSNGRVEVWPARA